MPQVADLKARISVEGADKAKADLKDVHKNVSSLAEGFKGGLGAVTGFLTGFTGFKLAGDALGFLKDQLLDVVKAGMDQQQVMAQTNAVIASTHGAAHMSAQAVGDLADQLANMSGISNDTIQSSENLLLTFRAVGSDTFPTATKAILDMSVAMHEDLQSATIQVGKALQDPIHGVTTLQRVGVQLDEGQKKLIATYMKHGEAAKAQAVILDELNKEFGGSAKAAGQTLPGQIARLNESWDQAKEKIAATLIPILQQLLEKYIMPLADWLSKFLPVAITTLSTFIDTQLVPAINGLMQSPVVKTLEGWATAITNKVLPSFGSKNGLTGGADNAKAGLKRLKEQTDKTGDAVAGPFVAKVQRALNKLDDFTNAVSPPKDPKNGGATGATLRFNAALDRMDAQLDKHAAATQKSTQASQNSIPVISGIGDKFREAGQSLAGFVNDINSRLPGAMPQIQRFGTFLSGTFQGALPGLRAQWEGFWAFLSMPVRIALESVHTVFNAGLDLLQGDWKKMFKDTQAGNDRVQGIFQDGLRGLGRIVLGGWQAVVGGWMAAFQNLPNLFSPEVDKVFNQIGQFMWKKMHEIGNQISAALSDWYDRFRQFWNSLPNFPGKSNLPSRGNGGGGGGGGSAGGFGGPRALMPTSPTTFGGNAAFFGGMGGGGGTQVVEIHVHTDLDGHELAHRTVRYMLPGIVAEIRRTTGTRL